MVMGGMSIAGRGLGCLPLREEGGRRREERVSGVGEAGSKMGGVGWKGDESVVVELAESRIMKKIENMDK